MEADFGSLGNTRQYLETSLMVTPWGMLVASSENKSGIINSAQDSYHRNEDTPVKNYLVQTLIVLRSRKLH